MAFKTAYIAPCRRKAPSDRGRGRDRGFAYTVDIGYLKVSTWDPAPQRTMGDGREVLKCGTIVVRQQPDRAGISSFFGPGGRYADQ